MGNSFDKILPGLFVGNIRGGKNKALLEHHNITHIVSVYEHAKPVHENCQYFCIQAADKADVNLKKYFSDANAFIHQARLDGHSVLVHCLAGVSRSVTVVVAYLMTITDLTWRQALQVVRAHRPSANPNFGFQRQLLEFYHDELAQEKSQFWSHFVATSHDDVNECNRLLKMYEDWVAQSTPQQQQAEDSRTYPLGIHHSRSPTLSMPALRSSGSVDKLNIGQSSPVLETKTDTRLQAELVTSESLITCVERPAECAREEPEVGAEVVRQVSFYYNPLLTKTDEGSPLVEDEENGTKV